MERPQKSVLKAYLYLFLLGFVGAHRVYMKRPGTGLFIGFLTVVAVSTAIAGLMREQTDLLYTGAICGALVLAAMLADLVMIPGMIEELNNPGEDRRVAVIAGNLDPSFQATMQRVGRGEEGERPRKSALPDNYERPWHKEKKQSDVYRPGDE